MANAVEVKNLMKLYQANQAVNNVSFEVKQGEIFALLGANGAGKTTVLECIEGLRPYDGGVVRVNGKVGVQLQASSIMPECRVREAVTLFSLWNNAEASSALSLLDLKEIENKPYGSLSLGQKKRLHLVLALLGNPDILILDEPTAGLDVDGRMQLHVKIHDLKTQGKTIILASHDMAEVEELCDRVAILRGGVLVFIGSPEALRTEVGRHTVLKLKLSEDISRRHFDTCTFIELHEGYHSLETRDIAATLSEVLSCKGKSTLEVFDVKVERTSLEQRFLELTKEAQK